MENKVKLMRCKKCGQISSPWFGFYAPCPRGAYGRHEEKEETYVTIKEASERLKLAYNEVQSFDRNNFDKNASEEYKKLLRI